MHITTSEIVFAADEMNINFHLMKSLFLIHKISSLFFRHAGLSGT